MSIMQIHQPPPKPPKSPHKTAAEAVEYLFKYVISVVIAAFYALFKWLRDNSPITIPVIVGICSSFLAYAYAVEDSSTKDAQVYVLYKHVDGSMKIVNIENLEVAEAAISDDEFVVDETSFTILGDKKLKIVPTNKKKVTVRTCVEAINTKQHLFVNTSAKYGIPASVIAAQYILESRAGQSQLAKQANNFFGIKYLGDEYKRTIKNLVKVKNGRVVTFGGHDDCCNRGKKKCKKKDQFASFKSEEAGFEAYGIFLQQPRYAKCHKLKKTDYKGWIKAMWKAGYATDPQYAQKVIGIIEKYKLYELDAN